MMFNRNWLEVSRFYHLQRSVVSFVKHFIKEEVLDKTARSVNTIYSGDNFCFICGSEIKNHSLKCIKGDGLNCSVMTSLMSPITH